MLFSTKRHYFEKCYFLRKYSSLKTCIDISFVWTKKRKLNDCNNGVQNMIMFAYELHNSVVLFPTDVRYRE